MINWLRIYEDYLHQGYPPMEARLLATKRWRRINAVIQESLNMERHDQRLTEVYE